MILKVKRVGVMPGLYRELFRGENRRNYVRQEDFPGKFVWYLASKDFEPEAPLRGDVEVQIINGKP